MNISTATTSNTKPLKEREAAEIIGFSVHWLRRKRWSGDGPNYLKMGPGAKAGVRYLLADLLDFINKNKINSTSRRG